ncbi:MAG TPA: prolyl oligopeptidase family serine peptidase [Gammaproteobacteria bacterium]
MTISPDGRYLALAMPSGDQTGLQIVDIGNPEKGLVSTAAYRFPALQHVYRINWASNTRVVFETTREYDLVGDIQPRLTGTIYAMNADGSDAVVVHGNSKGYNPEYASVVDGLQDDPNHVLIYRRHYGKHEPEIVRLNIFNGDDEVIARSPFDGGGFVLDNGLVARVAYDYDGMDESMKFAWRSNAGEDWKTRRIPKEGGFVPRGFTRDGTLVVESYGSPLGYFGYEMETGKMFPLLTDETVEPGFNLTSFDERALIGATFNDGLPENRYFDESDPDVRIRRMIEKAFPGVNVRITSATRGGGKLIVSASADRMPTDYYLFDVATRRADFLLSSYEWLDPATLGIRKPVEFKARDGITIHGYLTLPPGAAAKNLPMVTIVHGGPHGIRDDWFFDYEAQLLATRGYAVLQINYRGSGGYGEAFQEAGWRNWGTRIQDDIEDGVLWAVAEGIADRNRLCIYGASFGGYSVLSQLTRQPDLFKCGFAFVGIYDLELMYDVGDVQYRDEGEAYLQRVIGTDKTELRAQSPIHFVDRIKADLYVAHGREDERAHVNHYLSLLDALDAADIPYQEMLKHKEAHGFHDMENRIELYTDLVEFIDRNIGAE